MELYYDGINKLEKSKKYINILLMVVSVSAGAHSFSQYVKFSEKRAFLTP